MWLVENSDHLQENRGTRLPRRDAFLLPLLPPSLQWTQPTRECTQNPEECSYPNGESLFACNKTKTSYTYEKHSCTATQASAEWYDRERNERDFEQVSLCPSVTVVCAGQKILHSVVVTCLLLTHIHYKKAHVRKCFMPPEVMPSIRKNFFP